MDFSDRTVIGLTEDIEIIGKNGKKKVIARIDTGATKSSVHKPLADELDLGPKVSEKLVKSASGHTIRPIVKADVIIAKKSVQGQFTIADRSHMKYQVLIGQDILKQGFVIDPNKQ